MHVKKIKKPIEKTGYPAGYPNPDFQNPGIRYPGSKSVSGTTLLITIYDSPTYTILRKVWFFSLK